jgi:hypothetical protein
MILVIKILFTTSQLLVSESLRMVKSIGLSVTPGVLIGVKVVSLEFAEVSIILPSRVLAHGPLHLILGARVCNTLLHQRKRPTVKMIKLFTPSLSRYTHPLTSQMISFQRPTTVVESKKLLSPVVRRKMLSMLGT